MCPISTCEELHASRLRRDAGAGGALAAPARGIRSRHRRRRHAHATRRSAASGSSPRRRWPRRRGARIRDDQDRPAGCRRHRPDHRAARPISGSSSRTADWCGSRCCRRRVHGWINLHFSLLPRWRGAAPVQHALIAGDAETGADVFQLVRRARRRRRLRASCAATIPADATAAPCSRSSPTRARTCSPRSSTRSRPEPPSPSRRRASRPTRRSSATTTAGSGGMSRARPCSARIRGVTPEPGAHTTVDGARRQGARAPRRRRRMRPDSRAGSPRAARDGRARGHRHRARSRSDGAAGRQGRDGRRRLVARAAQRRAGGRLMSASATRARSPTTSSAPCTSPTPTPTCCSRGRSSAPASPGPTPRSRPS